MVTVSDINCVIRAARKTTRTMTAKVGRPDHKTKLCAGAGTGTGYRKIAKIAGGICKRKTVIYFA